MKLRSLALVTACAVLSGSALAAEDAVKLLRRSVRYLEPLPAAMPGAETDTQAKIALGKKLFFDKRLSINDQQSCASCHLLDDGKAGVDNLPTSPGAKGEFGNRNTPTVLNAGWQIAQFWDGRAANLAAQAREPILNPIEMGMPDEQFVVDKLRAIDEYPAAFADAFPSAEESLSYDNLTEAIAAFERTLRGESRFDDFLNGDLAALDQPALRGLKAFIRQNCVKCHDGPLLGGGVFEKLGEHGEYANTADLGRFEVTGEEKDKWVFKVPSLRNVALTAPYFHDGGIATLDEAVKTMGRLQLGREFDDALVSDIVAFLETLSDKERGQ